MPTTVTNVPLRLVVLSPPAGVVFAVQLGRTELLPPVRVTAGALVFEWTVQVAAGPRTHDDALPVLRGPAVQGRRREGHFVYLNSGRRAGHLASPWERRAKVPLAGITFALLADWRDAASGGRAFLAGRIAGMARAGGPACAGVPLLDDGWKVETT